jgi:uncharacterized protein YerC
MNPLDDFPNHVAFLIKTVNSIASKTEELEWSSFDDKMSVVSNLNKLISGAKKARWLLKMFEIVYYREQGYSYEKISKLTGIYEKKVAAVIRNGFPEFEINPRLIRAKEKDRQILDLYMSGISKNQIKKELHVGNDRLARVLDGVSDIRSMHKKAKDQKIVSNVIRLRHKGMSYKAISQELAVSAKKVSRIVKDFSPDLACDYRILRYKNLELSNKVLKLRFNGASYNKIYKETGVGFLRAKEIIEGHL